MSSLTVLMNARVLHSTFDMDSLFSAKYMCILMLMTIYECKFLYKDILSLVSLLLKLYMY